MTTTATKTRGSRRRGKRPALAPTLGPQLCRWIERHLVHAEGDYLGQPIALRDWEKRLIYRAYELDRDGTRRYSRGLWGLPKGNAKTEIAAMLAIAELAGPVVCVGWKEKRPIGGLRTSPDIPVAAASYDQADILFSAASAMIREGPLADHFEVYESEILPRRRAGRLYKVAAVAGTNDGRRPTFFVADELHEWTGNKERVHLVLSNGRAKRAGAWELAISTAGWDSTSLLGRLHQHGLRVRAGEVDDPRFLFEWFEAPADADLADPEQLEAAILAANPAAGDFLPIDAVRQRYYESPEFEFRRYHLNQWVSAPERWIAPDVWASAARPDGAPPEKTPIALGFDGSYSGDSTAVVGCTLEGHLFVIKAWEKPALAREDWRVDIGDVEQEVRNACARWTVKGIGCDPYRWQRSLQALLDEGLPIVEWPSHTAARMVPACTQFYDGVANGRLTHDGNEQLAAHVAHAVVKIDSRGPRITKEHKHSERRIDLAVAAVIAYDMAIRMGSANRPSVYETREPLVLDL